MSASRNADESSSASSGNGPGLNRRELILGAGAAAGYFVGVTAGPRPASAQTGAVPAIVDPLFSRPVADPARLPKFVTPLPNPLNPGFILAPNTRAYPGSDFYTISMRQFRWQVLPAGLPATTVWGYGDPARRTSFSYPGNSILAQRGRPVRIRFIHNELPSTHLLPVDRHIHGTHMGEPEVRTVVHLHGGHVVDTSDGGPEAWASPGGVTGPDYNPAPYVYANDQEGTTLWFHDHALGITRLNVYAGLAAFYLLRDGNEARLQASGLLPQYPYEVPLAIQDRTFYPNGALAYPDLPFPVPPGHAPWPGGPSILPEFFGNSMLVNGRTWPVLDVEPRKYRLRFLNGCNSRFLNMWITPVGTSRPGTGPQFVQIGTDGGLLNAPVPLVQLALGPAERADCIIDFSAFAGQTLVVRNDAPTPFPMGDPVDPATTGQVMQIRVSLPLNRSIPDTRMPTNLRPVHGPIAPLAASAAPRRVILFEGMDHFGRMQPLLGTAAQGAMTWMDPVTENPALNGTEVWEVYNTTVDAHPVHLHLVQFQILSRQRFRATQAPSGALSGIRLLGTPAAPAPNERGWKDTVRMMPGEVTRIIARFDLPGRYVWHCHILEHEDHEMMRPLHVGPLP